MLKEIDRACEGSSKDKDMSSDEAKRREWVLFLFPFFLVEKTKFWKEDVIIYHLNMIVIFSDFMVIYLIKGFDYKWL